MTLLDLDLEPLRSIGLHDAAWRQLQPLLSNLPALPGGPSSAPDAPSSAPTLRAMRLTELHRDTTVVHDGRSARRARVLPQLRRELERRGETLAVGDWLLGVPDAHGDEWVHARVPPWSQLVRRDGDGHRHALVNNADVALLVMGLDGDFNPRRLERYLALVRAAGLVGVLVLSKADRIAPERLDAARAQLGGRIPPEIGLITANLTEPSTAAHFAPWLEPGTTLVVLGSSGAGKSTLTNTLLGTAAQSTGAVRAHDSRGMHTTTARSLHCLPGGACIIDTPGLRTLGLDGDESALRAGFADIEALAERCRFRDCSHAAEPGCAVRAAVPPDRLRNYHKLLRELRRDTLDPLQRRAELALWKARGREGGARAKAKRGLER